MGPSSSVTLLATASTSLTSRINGMTKHCKAPFQLALSVSFFLVLFVFRFLVDVTFSEYVCTTAVSSLHGHYVARLPSG